MRRKAATDRNHQEIMDAFRKFGFEAVSLHQCGMGIPDIVVSKNSRTRFVEIKDGFKKRKLTPPQVYFHTRWNDLIHIVCTIDDVLKISEEWA